MKFRRKEKTLRGISWQYIEYKNNVDIKRKIL